MKHKDLRVIDFFCGAGGFSEGFRQQGFKVIMGVDNWRPAVETHNLNHGLNDVPRGSLGHWIRIAKKKIKNYQYVVPSTWNLGPRCSNGKRGPVEEALIGTPVEDPARPLEILRTVHSFDPCIACAVHVIDPHSNHVYKVRAL